MYMRINLRKLRKAVSESFKSYKIKKIIIIKTHTKKIALILSILALIWHSFYLLPTSTNLVTAVQVRADTVSVPFDLFLRVGALCLMRITVLAG